MKKKQVPVDSAPQPRQTTRFMGHGAAESTVLESILSGKMPHAWLISGPKGIGKATFAYRIARFLFSDGGDQSYASSLDTDPQSSVARRIGQKSFPDLLVLEEPFVNDDGKPVKELSVHMVREIGQFLRLSASESSRRIVIIDSVDDMNANAANALLKLLEEPPSHAYLFLISHSPGKVLPTLRSRCRQLKMQMPAPEEAVRIVEFANEQISGADAAKYVQLAGGSPGLAVTIYQQNGLALYQQILDAIDLGAMSKVFALAETLTSKDNDARWQLFCRFFTGFLEKLIKRAVGDAVTIVIEQELSVIDKLAAKSPLEKWLDLWEKSTAMLEEADRAHLDRKQITVLLFQQLLTGK